MRSINPHLTNYHETVHQTIINGIITRYSNINSRYTETHSN
jgi:hypothetical protein